VWSEITECRAEFSVQSARRLYNATLVIFGSQFRVQKFRMWMVRVTVQDGETAVEARKLKLGVHKNTKRSACE
jgi:hypothetical protein